MLGEIRVLVYGVHLIKAFSALQMILESCSFYFSLFLLVVYLPPEKTDKAKLVKTIMGPFKFEMFLCRKF